MMRLHKLVLVCAFSVLSLGALAQTQPAEPPYNPQSGQSGKDVVWVPTPQALVDRMLDMAELTKADYLIDLGAGDGRTVITAAKRGVRAHGIEYNPEMVTLANYNAQKEGVTKFATFAEGDIFQSNFSDATVITLFLLPNLNMKLRPTLLGMKPGTRVLSNTFNMEDWTPDETINAGGDCVSWCTAYKWVIPARVGGDWRFGYGQLKLTQYFQILDGALIQNGQSLTLSDAKMNGEHIAFTAGGQRYTGRVSRNTMHGTIEGGGSWVAARD